MSTRELIEVEIERFDEAQLDELLQTARRLAAAKKADSLSLMQKLQRVKIEAPEDFSENLDLYASGEKRV